MATKGGALRRFFLCLTGGFLGAALKPVSGKPFDSHQSIDRIPR